jgi:serine/threonine protein kinase
MSAVVPRPGELLRAESGRDYRLQAWHAEGSYARVFRAAAIPSGAPCAIKLAKAEVAGAAERLAGEAEARRRFRHPQVPALLDAGRAGELPFLALAWIEGPTLRALVERHRRLPLVVALALLHDAAAVTAQMHAAGLVHGDLRAENILIANGDGRARAMVTDLGAAPGCSRPEFDAAAADDVRRLAELLYLMLTGTAAEREPGRLSAAHGHHPAAVRLWESAARGTLTAPAFLREVEALQRAINSRR